MTNKHLAAETIGSDCGCSAGTGHGAHETAGCGCAAMGDRAIDSAAGHPSNRVQGDACAVDDDGCGCGCGHDHDEEEEMKPHQKVSLVLAGVFVAVGLVGEHLFGNELAMMVASFISIAFGLVIVLPETRESIKARSIDINILLIVAIIGAVYVQAYEEAAAVLFLFSVGEYLEGRAMRKSSDAIKDLAKLAPDMALVLRNGERVEVPTDQVAKGETLLLKPGTAAPLDGVITKGASSFNDAAITGESIPVHKTAGDTVFAASIAVDGSCEIKTTSTVADSTLAKIAEMVKDAQKQKSERENFVKRFAKVYTPLVIVAAVLVAFVPPAIGMLASVNLGDFNTWIYRACELLVISCPCAFVISTPVTVVSALTRAAKLGVLVKGGAFFEEGAEVNVVAFDKTGTLTEGKPAVSLAIVSSGLTDAADDGFEGDTGLEAVGRSSLTNLISIGSALEQHSTHPLAAAVVAYGQSQGIESFPEVDNIRETAGKGLIGEIGGVPYLIGSESFAREEAKLEAPIQALAEQAEGQAGSTLFLARLGDQPHVIGVFVVEDAVRESATNAISGLRKVRPGMRTAMLTGDNERVAQSVAAKTGVDEVHAALLPQGKTEEIARLSEKYGSVAFAGDGINDTPSLAASDIGIAMGGAGSAAALSSADVVLMADDLSALPKFFSLSKKTVAVLKQNIVLAIGIKVLVALLVVVGIAQMWMAVAADTGVSLLVIANGMRLLRMRLQ